ncbi:MazG nucleotide pyrophosphohydrolase domain-containing protein [Clostridium magnum]|uniref:Nucleoside triphosphate pyrophosphohydrolase n=1 Tax=Clostridium magnum DSM 2767 TaxID=1121326 RepID=A0A161X485_9CLOT|nr:MazG nucleotide pyrophosphohydrolase domain-containing protein [Clostridium magnum]KZL94348.1 nucleoside triphosphate pyrophosphohydrolase [Clostridium magnum DSM 2767]SHJ52569.1 NTP pyrophosphatase, house-cleaning of non-canonical NTPs [Clostridium magnum DSM 2767]
MKLMVLDKNKKLGCDNSKWSFKDVFKKLKEEVNELGEAIEEGDKDHIAEEVLDVVQVCIAILFKLFMNGINIEDAVHKHNKKLTDRFWKPKAVIKITVNRK